jgi:hypothetical protein
LYFVTPPTGGKYHVCRNNPGKKATHIASSADRQEAEKIADKLNLLVGEIPDYDVPDEFLDLIGKISTC